MYKKIILAFICLFPVVSYSASPVCYTNSVSSYCQYTGKVQKIYVNSNKLILLYFEDPVDVDMANSYGMNISHNKAAAFRITDGPDFAKMFYSTALAAQASGRPIVIQMRGSVSGYLKLDRIWLAAP